MLMDVTAGHVYCEFQLFSLFLFDLHGVAQQRQIQLLNGVLSVTVYLQDCHFDYDRVRVILLCSFY